MTKLRFTNYKDTINIPKSNFKNKVTVNLEEDHDGKILLEISYMKGTNIYNKNLKIFKVNLVSLLEKFKSNKFLILQNNNTDKVSSIEDIVGNQRHPEYTNKGVVDFIRNSYNKSFNQKFK